MFEYIEKYEQNKKKLNELPDFFNENDNDEMYDDDVDCYCDD